MSSRKLAAKEFSGRWKNRGSEKQETQSFWIDLLQNVYNIENATEYIKFEDTVSNMMDGTSFMDGYIDTTHVLIEQKGINRDLNKGIKQSDGSYITPFQQAKRYSANLPYSRRPRWIITSNFKEFFIYDMENPKGEPSIVELSELETDYYRLEILVDKTNTQIEKETEVSLQAGELIGEIYRELYKQYNDPTTEQAIKSINQLCVRFVFCFYAEDAGLFGNHGMFHNYLEIFDENYFREAIIKLFEVLNTPEDARDPYADERLNSFPYVNGGLFADEDIEIPRFTKHLRNLIIKNASSDFNWSNISPTIFGSVFESTLNPEERHEGGMHYTSIENIHKVIDPLFLDELKEQLNEIRQLKTKKNRIQKAKEFQNKLANLTFLDPASGSGNFLTETYLAIRELENQALKLIHGTSPVFDIFENIIKVTLDQFYGIEINDFAVATAKTALWIAESQMFERTKEVIWNQKEYLPLSSYSNIVEGNALQIDWNDVIDHKKLSYIIGNPPFLGYKKLKNEQKDDLQNLFTNMRSIDYVAGWYYKSLSYIQETSIRCAFVSTSSITQGSAIQNMWEPLDTEFEFEIDFSHQSFIWNSDATNQASVYCVIVGFSYKGYTPKVLYNNGSKELVSRINPYLVEGDFITMKRLSKPIAPVSKMTKGAQLIDGSNFRLTEAEKDEFINKGNEIEPYIYKYLNAQNFLNTTDYDENEYCLYLTNCPPNIINGHSKVKERVRKVKEYRENSKAETTKKLAETPALFFQKQVPKHNNIVIPVVSSENRRYIPMAFMPNQVVYTNALFYVDNASIYEFGVLMSNMHMAWMRVFAGRLKSDYRYSNTMVYNTYPWPEFNEKSIEVIKQTARGILEARKLYPDASLADLYDEIAMPVELRKAHQKNDIAVMKAYGLEDIRGTSESDAVAHLLNLYDKKVNS